MERIYGIHNGNQLGNNFPAKTQENLASEERNVKDIRDITINNKSNTCFPIYNMRLAGHLMNRGFILVDMAPNKRQRDKNVFYFKDTVQIQEAIQEYLNKA